MNNTNETNETNPLDPFAAFVAVDWAEEKHAFTLQAAGRKKKESGPLEQTPEQIALSGWRRCASASADARWPWRSSNRAGP